VLESEERGAVFHFLGGQADFFMILVVISLAAGVLLLGITGQLCRLMHSRLGTISHRSCEIAPCIAAGTGRILSGLRRPDGSPRQVRRFNLLPSVPGASDATPPSPNGNASLHQSGRQPQAMQRGIA
jgi:hypothetical protein